LAAGQGRTEFLRTGQRVRITERNGRPRWHELWQGLDWIAAPHETGDFATIINAPGARPYVQYPWNGGRQTFTDWRARDHIGGIVFTHEELAFADRVARLPFVLIEPHTKRLANPNKQWGFDRWQRLVELMSGIRWVQVGAPGTRQLRGVTLFVTRTFRQAAAVVARAELSVLPDGGLHHAAGHLGKKAVVLFGGVTPVETLGYPIHDNVAVGEPCGEWRPCAHCAAIWRSITPEMVRERIEAALRGRNVRQTERGAPESARLGRVPAQAAGAR
jgi:hypothetical protein